LYDSKIIETAAIPSNDHAENGGRRRRRRRRSFLTSGY
jgi:hypothetical protein